MIMRRVSVGVTIGGMLLCSVLVLGSTAFSWCDTVLMLCRQQPWMGLLAPVGHGVLLTALLLSLVGLVAGGWQLIQTQRMLQPVLRLPRPPWSADLVALVRRLGLQHRLMVIESSQTDAFCYGLFQPQICITTGLLALLSLSEVEAVLRHERHHLQRRDPLRTLLWTMLCGGGWWCKKRREQAHLDRELQADQAVIQTQGRQPLAQALVTLLTTAPAGQAMRPHLAIGGLSITQARIDQLIHGRQQADHVRTAWWASRESMLMVTVLIMCLVLIPIYR